MKLLIYSQLYFTTNKQNLLLLMEPIMMEDYKWSANTYYEDLFS
jgi:hypothetical protein